MTIQDTNEQTTGKLKRLGAADAEPETPGKEQIAFWADADMCAAIDRLTDEQVKRGSQRSRSAIVRWLITEGLKAIGTEQDAT